MHRLWTLWQVLRTPGAVHAVNACGMQGACAPNTMLEKCLQGLQHMAPQPAATAGLQSMPACMATFTRSETCMHRMHRRALVFAVRCSPRKRRAARSTRCMHVRSVQLTSHRAEHTAHSAW
jgi:hypothetical protein